MHGSAELALGRGESDPVRYPVYFVKMVDSLAPLVQRMDMIHPPRMRVAFCLAKRAEGRRLDLNDVASITRGGSP